MKKILVVILLLSLLISTAPTAFADEVTIQFAADRLVYYDLLKGTENGLELERAPTRLEALAMIFRLMGQGGLERSDSTYLPPGWVPHPFVDVPSWGEKYVTHAYNAGITKGISETEYGCDLPVTSVQFTTMLLRCLMFDDTYGVFDPENPFAVSDFMGVTNGRYDGSETFTRGDMSLLCYNTLGTPINGYPMHGILSRYSYSHRYSAIGANGKADDGLEEFGTYAKNAPMISAFSLSLMPAMTGTHSQHFEGASYKLMVGVPEGQELFLISTDPDILEITVVDEPGVSPVINDGYCSWEVIVRPLKEGKAAVIATSEGYFQARHIEVLYFPDDIAMYEAYPDVPDLGALYGIEEIDSGDGWFAYDLNAIKENSPYYDWSEYYLAALSRMGYTYLYENQEFCMLSQPTGTKVFFNNSGDVFKVRIVAA